MFTLIYASRDDFGFDGADLAELCAKSARKNEELSITGYLYYRHGQFFQYLEGEQDAVVALMGQIRRDARHTIFSELQDETLQQRRFPDWSMRYIHPDGLMFEDAIAIQMKVLARSETSEAMSDRVWQTIDKLSELRAHL